MPDYVTRRTKSVRKSTGKTLHVLIRNLHPANRKTDHSMVVASCFDGLRSVGVFTGRLSEIKQRISRIYLDEYPNIVYT